MVVVRRLQAVIETDGVGEFANEMDAAQSSLLDFKQTVGLAGAALAALSVGGLAVAVNEARKFQNSMVELEKVTNPQVVGELSDKLREMATVIPIAQAGLVDIAADAARFGITGSENILRFTESVAKMAAATSLTTEEAGQALAKLSMLTRTPVEQVENLGSAINALANTTASSTSGIVDAMLRSSAAMSQFGMTNTDIAAVNAALISVSDSSERAGSRLRRLFQEMVEPKKIVDLAAALGLTVDQYKAMQQNSPIGLLQRMVERFKAGGQAADLLNMTLSTTSRQALAGLAQNLAGLNQALATSRREFRKNTSLQHEFIAASKTFDNQVQLLINRLRNLAISVGQILLPPLTSLVRGMSSAVDVLVRFNAMTGNTFAAATLLSGVIVGLSAAIYGLAGSATAGLVIGALGTAAATLGPPLIALTAIITALGTAWEHNFLGIRDVTMATLGRVQASIQSFMSWARSRWRVFTTTFAERWSLVGTMITRSATSMFGNLREVIAGGLSVLRAIWRGDTQAIVQSWQAMVRDLKQIILTGMEGLRNAVVYGMTAVILAFNDAFAGFPLSAALALQDVANVVFSGLNAIVEGLLDFRADSQESWGVTMAAWESLTQTHIPNVVASIRTGLYRIPGVINRIKSRILIIWRGIWPLLPQPVQQAITVISGHLQRLYGEFVRVVGQIRAAVIPVWRSLSSTLSSIFGPAIARVTGFVRSLAHRLGFLNRQGTITRNGLIAIGTTLLSLLNPFGLVTGAIIKLASAWSRNLFGIRTVTTQVINEIRRWITQVLGVAFTRWREDSQQVLTATRRAWTGIRRVISGVVNFLVGSVIRPAVTTIMRLWSIHGQRLLEDARQTWTAIQTIIRGAIAVLIPIVRTGLRAIGTVIKLTLQGALAFWRLFGDEIITIARFSFDLVGTIITNALDIILTAIDVLTDLMVGDWRGAFTAVKNLTMRLLGNTGAFIKRWVPGVELAFRGLQALVGLVRGIFTAIGNVIGLVMGQSRRTVRTGTGAIARAWNVIHPIVQVVRGVFNTIRTVITGVISAIRRVVTGYTSWLIGLWRRHGGRIVREARLTWNAWANAITGIINGIRQFIGQVWRAIATITGRIWRGIQRTVTSLVRAIVPPIRAAWNAISRVTTRVWNEIQRTVTAVARAIVPPLRAAWNTISRIVTRTTNEVKQVATSGFRVIKTVVTTLSRALTPVVRSVWNTIKTIINGVLNIVKTIVKTALGALLFTWRTQFNAIKAVTQTVFNAIKSVIGAVVDTIATIIVAFLRVLRGDFRGAWTAIEGLTRRIWTGIQRFIQSVTRGIKRFVTRTWNAMTRGVSRATNGVKNAVTRAWRDIKQSVSGTVRTVSRTVTRVFNGMKRALSGAVRAIKRRVTRGFADVKRAVSNAVRAMLRTVRNVIGDFKNAGQALMGAFSDGISSKIGAIKDKVSGAVNWVRDRLPGSDARYGPLSDLTAAGAAFPETFAAGIEENLRPLEQATRDTALIAQPLEPLPATPATRPAGTGGQTTHYHIDVTVPQSVDVDTASRSIADEIKSRDMN